MWWMVGVVALVVLLATYLTWTATRVDRLHARAASAARSLDAHLLRRAAAAAVLAEERLVTELYSAARIALDAGSDEREAAENDLTRQLRAVPLPAGEPAADAVVAASRRLALARQVHTDVVRDTLSARGRPLVRVLRLGRRHELPAYFEIDDPTLAVTATPGDPRPGLTRPSAGAIAPVRAPDVKADGTYRRTSVVGATVRSRAHRARPRGLALPGPRSPGRRRPGPARQRRLPAAPGPGWGRPEPGSWKVRAPMGPRLSTIRADAAVSSRWRARPCAGAGLAGRGPGREGRLAA